MQRGGGGGGRQQFSRSEPGDDTNELFVSNVGQLSEDSLYSHFEKFGTVQRVKIATDRETGESKGFAFVTFDTVDEAKSAVNGGSEAEVSNNNIFCYIYTNVLLY